MRADLRKALTQRLIKDYGFKRRGEYLQQGVCPQCGKKELYTSAQTPWVVRCNRENKCAGQWHVKDVYPELFHAWSQRYPVSPRHPHAAADAYLREGRGFDLARLKGCYSQESYVDHVHNLSTATVRFHLDNGAWWERLIDDPQRFGGQKARFAPGKKRGGVWWQLPDSDPAAQQLWLVEGIFDAIALELNGFAARALLSCNNYPQMALEALAKQCEQTGRKRPVLIWALDHDEAGQKHLKKWVKQAREAGWVCQAAQIPVPQKGKVDWNDLHQLKQLNKSEIEAYLYQGTLLLARSAEEKATLLFNRKRRWQFHFEFGQKLYWFHLDPKRFEEEGAAGPALGELNALMVHQWKCVRDIANCVPQVLYYQQNKVTNESWYYYKIHSPSFRQPLTAAFTARQRTVSSEFKTQLMHVAPGSLWTGTQKHLDSLLRENDRIMRVETIDYIGYSREHGCYVFDEVAMQQGKLARRNDEDYFELGALNIKSLSQSVALQINTEPADYRNDWVHGFWECFGAKGMVALTFWFGSLFAEQIRDQDESFPFLEIVGEAGSGKSTLVEFLWKLVGRRDYEGFDPSKSTHAARSRNLAQVSNLPVVLIESDRENQGQFKQKGFDWNELKTAYNGRSVRARGMKNNGNETYEPPFRGSVVIAQNHPVQADEAVMQRIVHLEFDKSQHSRASKPLAETLARMPMKAVSGFLLKAIAQEQPVLETVKRLRPVYEEQLLARSDIRNTRLAKNHAQLMALADALAPLIGLSPAQQSQTRHLLEQMTVERQQAINLDHPLVEAFWEQFDFLDGHYLKNGDQILLNHHRDETMIAVNLVEYDAACTRAGLHLPCELVELKKLLKSSVQRKFVTSKTLRSAHAQRTAHCWLFQAGNRRQHCAPDD